MNIRQWTIDCPYLGQFSETPGPVISARGSWATAGFSQVLNINTSFGLVQILQQGGLLSPRINSCNLTIWYVLAIICKDWSLDLHLWAELPLGAKFHLGPIQKTPFLHSFDLKTPCLILVWKVIYGQWAHIFAKLEVFFIIKVPLK